jgi:hypothetical protein
MGLRLASTDQHAAMTKNWKPWPVPIRKSPEQIWVLIRH